MRNLIFMTAAIGLLSTFPALGLAGEPAEIPIEISDDRVPGSLHRWHLYESTDAKSAVGKEISLVGLVKKGKSEVALFSPPWVTVALPLKSPAANANQPTWQTFHFHVDNMERILGEGGFAEFTGTIGIHRPELTPQQKYDQGIPIFRLEGAKAKAIPLARSLDQLQQEAVVELRRAAPRLREACTQNHLQYAPDEKSFSASWYQDQIAFTTILSRHPGFSFRPVPYATISILFDPESGKATRLIFMNRIWQDPRD